MFFPTARGRKQSSPAGHPEPVVSVDLKSPHEIDFLEVFSSRHRDLRHLKVILSSGDDGYYTASFQCSSTERNSEMKTKCAPKDDCRSRWRRIAQLVNNSVVISTVIETKSSDRLGCKRLRRSPRLVPFHTVLLERKRGARIPPCRPLHGLTNARQILILGCPTMPLISKYKSIQPEVAPRIE